MPRRVRPLGLGGFVPAALEQQRPGSPGPSQVLEAGAAPAFALASGERLSLARVSVEVKPRAV